MTRTSAVFSRQRAAAWRPGGLRRKGLQETRGACSRAWRVRRYVLKTASAPGGLAVVSKVPLDSTSLRDCSRRDAASLVGQGLLAPLHTGGMCVLYHFCRPSLSS